MAKKRITVVLVGGIASGKSSFVHQLATGETFPYVPTTGTQTRRVSINDKEIEIVEVGGSMPSLVSKTHGDGHILIVDGAPVAGQMESCFAEARALLETLVVIAPEAPLLIVVNKSDDREAMALPNVSELLGLPAAAGSRPWRIVLCSARSGEGVNEAIEWTIERIKKGPVKEETTTATTEMVSE